MISRTIPTPPAAVEKPMVRRPLSPAATRCTRSSASDAASITARAPSTSTSPAEVSSTLPGVAHEQGDAELVLQPLDAGRQRLLGEVEPLRGAREVQLLRHREEVAQLAQLEGVEAGDGVGSLLHAANCRRPQAAVVTRQRRGVSLRRGAARILAARVPRPVQGPRHGVSHMTTFTPNPRRWWALAIIAIAQFMVIMDTSIIGVALPEIQRALGFSQAEPVLGVQRLRRRVRRAAAPRRPPRRPVRRAARSSSPASPS